MKKPAAELHFIHSRNSLPSVEINMDSIPHGFCGIGNFVVHALLPMVTESPAMVASLYVFREESCNFGRPGVSVFIGVGRNRAILNTLLEAFRSIEGIDAGLGEYINPSRAECAFHIQEGYVWRPLDAETWYFEMPESLQNIVPPMTADTNESDERKDPVEEIRTHPPAFSRSPHPVYVQAARWNARVGSMRQTIEKMFGLPQGSVALLGPDGNPLQESTKMETLRKQWE